MALLLSSPWGAAESNRIHQLQKPKPINIARENAVGTAQAPPHGQPDSSTKDVSDTEVCEVN